MRQGQQLADSGYSRISVQSSCRCSVCAEERLAQFLDGLLHRIERIALAGQDAELDQFVKRLRQAIAPPVLPQIAGLAVRRQPFARSSVQGQRPVLSTQRTVAEPRVSMAGMRRVRTLLLRNPPGAQSQEDRQHDGELLRQRGHRQGDARPGSPSSQSPRVRP